ncbi:MAG: fasciclin domain-containing protein [Pseudomonadota bacterium]
MTTSTPNIVDIAAGSDDFNLLVQALAAAGLVDTVKNLDDITVFAPTDAAFTQLAVDLGFDGDPDDEGAVFASLVDSLTELGGGDPIPLLTDVLLYHVSAGAKTAAEIDALDRVDTLLAGATFGSEGTELVDNEPDIANPNIVMPDIDAANGTIQAIDRVLLPIDIPGNEAPVDPAPTETLTGIVAASGGVFDDNAADFDILLNAVQAAGLAGALDDPNADLTVFAPNDAAFVGLAQTLGFKGEDEGEAFAYIVEALTLLSGGEDPIPLLTDILLYHVAPEALDSDAVFSADGIPTLLGTALGVDGRELVDQDPDIANPEIIATDIPATNGIAHVLDGVLLPADILNGDGGRGLVDFKIGDDGGETFRTGANTDFVSGLGGSDDIRLGKGDDIGLGGDGNDIIRGGRGDDIAKGGDGNDTLRGGRDNDTLDGGAGRDLLIGGRDNDVLTGGTDADIFRFHAHQGHDTITDFTSGEDLIQIRARGMRDFDDLEHRISDTEDGAVIHIRGTDILVEGVAASSLTESDFLFS